MKKIRLFLISAFFIALGFLSSCDNLIPPSSSIISSSSSSSSSSFSHEHTWDSGKVTKQPTCTEDGEKTYNCTHSNCEEIKVAIILATGHTEVVDEAVEPTCTTTGLTEGKHCSVCNDILVKQEEVPTLGHEYSSVVTNPTCEDKGYTTHTCNRCNDSYVDSHADALGHIEVVDAAVEPTCATTGLTEGKHCSTCNEVLVEQEVIPALGHDYKSVVTNPTFNQQGYTTHTCNVCSYSYEDNFVDELLIYALKEDGTYEIVGNRITQTNTILCIPTTYKGIAVTSIGQGAFKNNNKITEITNDNVGCLEYIGDYAFSYCRRVTLVNLSNQPNLIEIGRNAFESCSLLEEIILPSSIEIIGYNAFYDCSEILYYEYENCLYLGNEGNKYLVLMDVKNTSITTFEFLEDTKIIYHFAFQECMVLTEIELLEGIKSIGLYAFSNCVRLRKINLPSTLVFIGHNAFQDCKELECSEYDNGYYLGDIDNPYLILMKVIDNTTTSFIINDNTKYIYSSAFYGCTSLESVNMPDGLLSIGQGAFEGCSSLENIAIPDSVTSIGNFAFSNCSGLTKLDLGNGVESLGQYSFSGTKITGLIIPESLDVIYNASFYNNKKLSYIVIPKTVIWIQYEAFNNCLSLDTIYYYGTPEEWGKIKIGDGEYIFEDDNYYLKHANRLYYSEEKPNDTINSYWHFVDGVPTIWAQD